MIFNKVWNRYIQEIQQAKKFDDALEIIKEISLFIRTLNSQYSGIEEAAWFMDGKHPTPEQVQVWKLVQEYDDIVLNRGLEIRHDEVVEEIRDLCCELKAA